MEEVKLHLFDEFVLDTARGTLLRAGQPVHLRPQAYKTLKHLVENRGRLISKDRLIEEVWEGRAVTDGSLVQCLRDVRHALGEGGNHYLRNERGRGYIFDPETDGRSGVQHNRGWTDQVEVVRVLVEDQEEAELTNTNAERAFQIPSLTAQAMRESSARHSAAGNILSKLAHNKGATIIALSVLALTVAGVLYFTRVATPGKAVRSVAVLPFANASGDPNLEYLSEGLSESLIDRLSEVPGVKVIARTSTFKYKGQEIDPREVGKALGVEALLMGRVVQRGDDLRVRVELVDARTGTQVWGGQYSGRATDVQAVQEEMARAVSEKLSLRLTGDQEQRLTRRATENTQAYQFYLNGLFYSKRGGSVENIKRALDYFQQAVALDPNFALAWAAMASSHLAYAGNSWLDPKEANAKASAAVHNALRLDDRLPEAHVLQALLKQHDWDWAGAEREYKRALELNPSLIEAHNRYAAYLSIMQRHSEALAENKRVQELDPLRPGLRRREAWTLFHARRDDEALELMQQTLKVEADSGAHRVLGFMYEGKGMYEQAIAEHQKANSIEGETTGNLCYLGWALAGAGKRSEAQAILDRLKTTREYVSPAELAALYAMLGDREGAIALLEKAYAAHDLQLQYLNIARQYDSLRSDPRFQDLVRRVGLSDS